MDDDMLDDDGIENAATASWVDITCPYCGESFSTQIDASGGAQRYVEDCAVCCRPIEMTLSVDDQGVFERIDVSTDRE